jgi:hypothetical protein
MSDHLLLAQIAAARQLLGVETRVIDEAEFYDLATTDVGKVVGIPAVSPHGCH